MDLFSYGYISSKRVGISDISYNVLGFIIFTTTQLTNLRDTPYFMKNNARNHTLLPPFFHYADVTVPINP